MSYKTEHHIRSPLWAPAFVFVFALFCFGSSKTIFGKMFIMNFMVRQNANKSSAKLILSAELCAACILLNCELWGRTHSIFIKSLWSYLNEKTMCILCSGHFSETFDWNSIEFDCLQRNDEAIFQHLTMSFAFFYQKE